jgi:hypothetical protein
VQQYGGLALQFASDELKADQGMATRALNTALPW